MAHHKTTLPSKICPVCGKPFAWRKKWEKCWNEVKYCSERCRRSRHLDQHPFDSLGDVLAITLQTTPPAEVWLVCPGDYRVLLEISRFNPAKATGEDACPFTTLFWEFLDRHAERFASHPRMGFMISNLHKLSAAERAAIRTQAAAFRQRTA